MLPHRAVRARVAPDTRHRDRRPSSASYARVAQSPRECDRHLAEKRRQDAQVLLAQRHGDKREQACARLVGRGGERAEQVCRALREGDVVWVGGYAVMVECQYLTQGEEWHEKFKSGTEARADGTALRTVSMSCSRT